MHQLLAQGVNIGDEWELGTGKQMTGPNAELLYANTGAFISNLLKNIYIVSGVLLFALLIFAGISIILGAGSGDTKKTAQGQKAASSALVGIVIVFCSYWIIQIVEKVTGVKILSPGF